MPKLVLEISKSRKGYRLHAALEKDERRYPLVGKSTLIRIIVDAIKDWRLGTVKRFPRKFERLIEK